MGWKDPKVVKLKLVPPAVIEAWAYPSLEVEARELNRRDYETLQEVPGSEPYHEDLVAILRRSLVSVTDDGQPVDVEELLAEAPPRLMRALTHVLVSISILGERAAGN